MNMSAFVLLFMSINISWGDDGWVNQEVIPKRGTPEITQIDVTGKERTVGEIDIMPVTVKEEKGNLLKVQVRDVEGWVSKEQVVRVGDGIQYFTNRILSSDEIEEAYAKRAWIWFKRDIPDLAIKDADEAIRLNPTHFTYNMRGTAWFAKKDYDKAIEDYTQAIGINSRVASPFYNRGTAWKHKKEYGNAIRDYSEAIRLDPKQSPCLNALAWMLATCPDPKFRDGNRAVELASKLCELSSWNRPNHIDTLAAAFAEQGDFQQAIKYQSRVVSFSETEKESGKEVRQRLKLYEANKPYRE